MASSQTVSVKRGCIRLPVRNRKTILHVRRRRWLKAGGKSVSFPLEEAAKLVWEGTSYSKELALFLRERMDNEPVTAMSLS